MNVVGIIAEFNPFHSGHAHLIHRAKEITGSEYAVVVMNGSFVQRGEPAVFSKYHRTRAALEGGADLVLELPVRFGISSAGTSTESELLTSISELSTGTLLSDD